MDEYRSSMNLRDVIETLFRRRRLFLIVAGSVMGLAVLITLLTHKVYQSEMKFLVQNSRGNIIISAEKTAASTATADVTEQQINSEMEILYSKDVIEPVADPAWNPGQAAKRYPDEVKHHEQLVQDFQKRLAAEPIRKANVINVSITGKTPAEAQATLQRLSTAYLAEHRALQRPEGASQFFSNQAEHYRQEWDEATQELVAFQREHQMISPVDEQATLQKSVTLAQADLRGVDVSLQELQGRLKADTTRLGQTPQRQITTRKTVPQQQSIQQLTTLLVELQNKRTALLTQYKPEDRLVKEVNQQIAQTSTALDRAISGSAEELTSDVDPTWQQIRTGYAQDQIKREAAAQQKSALTHQVTDLQKKLAEIQALTVPYNLLASKVENLRENYQLYTQKRDQAQIEDAMDERKLLNITIAEQPTLSYTPLRPRPITNLALGMATALLLGLCGVYFAEMTRNTIATPRELEAATQLPVLATLPLVLPEPEDVNTPASEATVFDHIFSERKERA